MSSDTFGDMHMQATFRPKPDGALDPIGEAGWYLERERMRRGLSLQAAGRATGIHPHHLQAIEMGDIQGLPEESDALRMVGAYAAFLGFEPKPLVAHFAQCLSRREEGNDKTSARIIAFPLIERLRASMKGMGGVMTSVLGGVLLFGGLAWAVWPGGTGGEATRMAEVAVEEKVADASATTEEAKGDDARQVAALVNEREERLDDAAPTGQARANDPIGALIARTMPDIAGQPPVTEEAGQTVETQARAPRQEAPSTGVAVPDAEPRAERRTATERAAPRVEAPLARARIAPLAEVPASGLAIRATERIWVRLEDDGGNAHFSGFLDEGQVLALPADRQLRITAGNVHRLELYRDGRALGPLGKRGADLISVPVGKLSSRWRS